ncbi:MAG: hypothetical protein QOE90_64 [Thermoplasmata archaeon]|jgi:predicted transcriptional regulator|nr:hypothetical protein [Thermoplasmata archaeon]
METKHRILAYLRETPGASTQMVARHLRIDGSTADYHLRRMQARGALAREVTGREVRWFVVGCGLCPLLRVAVPALRNPGLAAVAAQLREFPDTAASIGERAGVDIQVARYAARSLAALGLAERTRTGRLQRAPGAEVCIAKALAHEGCDQWGKCAPSKAVKS